MPDKGTIKRVLTVVCNRFEDAIMFEPDDEIKELDKASIDATRRLLKEILDA